MLISLPLPDDMKGVAVYEDFGRFYPSVVVGTHGKAVGSGLENGQQVAGFEVG
jgi:hypothetical protein